MLSSIDPITLPSPRFRIAFSGPQPETAGAEVRLATPWLDGATTENLFENVTPVSSPASGIRLFRSGQLLIGHAQERFVPAELAPRTEALYRRILNATRGRHLYRIWNYVPQINAHTAGLEHYRAFCQGRAVAFEAGMGGEFELKLPAASAVGCQGSQVEAIFVAGEIAPTHFENPEQIPAYHYPIEYGPRPPSFARATVARNEQQTWTFISGTSAIKGHETVAPGRLDAQLVCTVDNLRLISTQAGLGADLNGDRVRQRHFKVYLRHATDVSTAKAQLERQLFRPGDVVTYLQCDICRAALNVEIEASLLSTAS